jgi:hypothetical protein
MTDILDAKYNKANLEEISKSADHLTNSEHKSLLKLLKKYEDCFDGMLGTFTALGTKITLIAKQCGTILVPHRKSSTQTVESLIMQDDPILVLMWHYIRPFLQQSGTFIVPHCNGGSAMWHLLPLSLNDDPQQFL